MRAYSLDLRERVVAAIGRGGVTIPQVAEAFGVGQTFVKKMLRQQRTAGDLMPKPHGGGQRARLSARHLAALQKRVEREPDATLGELRDHLGARHKVRVSLPTVSRALRRLDLPRKKSA